MSMEASLREMLEQIRGRPIPVQGEGPTDAPCAEASDAGRLCGNPVVSVHMLAYNHSSYIRQAIEGVLSQKTDFGFELVIGEDCSQDDTRVICLEYQKRFPDKVRVLWAGKRAGIRENYFRTLARCRGEFVAFCEGDDYWIDDGRLQRQVDVMREHPSVGICGARNKVLWQATGKLVECSGGAETAGFCEGRRLFDYLTTGTGLAGVKFGMGFFQTSSLLVRMSVFRLALDRYADLFSMHLLQLDHSSKMAIASLSDAWFSNEVVSVYRRNSGGVTEQANSQVEIDALVARAYMLVKVRGMSLLEVLKILRDGVFIRHMLSVRDSPAAVQMEKCRVLDASPLLATVFKNWRAWPHVFLLRRGRYGGRVAKWLMSLYVRLPMCRF